MKTRSAHHLFYHVVFFFLSASCTGQSYMWHTNSDGIYLNDYNLQQSKQIQLPNLSFRDIEIDSVNHYIITAESGSIMFWDTAGNLLFVKRLQGYTSIAGFDIDMYKRQLYILSGPSIYRLDYDGNTEVTLVTSIQYGTSICIDPIRNVMFWIEGYTSTSEIYGARLDGSNKHAVWSNNQDIRDMEIHVPTGRLYYYNAFERSIETVGGNTVLQFDQPYYYAESFSIDHKQDKVYFTNLGDEALYTFDLSTLQIEKKLQLPNNGDIIKISSGSVYVKFRTQAITTIQRIDPAPFTATTILQTDPTLRWFLMDETNNRGIGVNFDGAIVTTSPHLDPIRQHTEIDMEEINDVVVAGNQLVLADDHNIFTCNLDFTGLKRILISNDLNSDHLCYDASDQKIYFAVEYEREIYRCNADGSELELVFAVPLEVYGNEFYFDDIIYSPFTGRLYMTCSGDAILVSVNTNGTDFRTELTGNFDEDLANLAIDPTGRYLYYSSAKHEQVYKTDLLTGQRTDYVSNSYAFAGLIYSETDNCLYGYHSQNNIIYKITDQGVEVLATDPVREYFLAFFQLPDGKLCIGTLNEHTLVRSFDPHTHQYDDHLDRINGVQLYTYDSLQDEVFGTSHDLISSLEHVPFKLNLTTDSVTFFKPFTPKAWQIVFFPDNDILYYLSYDETYLVKFNYVSGSRDTIHTAASNRLTSVLYEASMNTIFVSTGYNKLLRFDSTGQFIKADTIDRSYAVLKAANAADSTLTYLYTNTTDIIHRWNHITSDIITLGEEKYKDSKLCFTILHEMYANIDDDNDGYAYLSDCNDGDPDIHPGMIEIAENLIDENCDGILALTDEDGDGIAAIYDCDDSDSTVHNYVLEIPNNDVDENCDGVILIIDEDDDGYNSDEDCNDNNANINPGETEIPNNFTDENCDDIVLIIDDDMDGYNSSLDCNDQDSTINPGELEIPNNAIDENCDNIFLIDLDGDGYAEMNDCNDQDSTVNPGAIEIPHNGIDEDCDSLDWLVHTIVLYDLDVRIYPNPASDRVMIETSTESILLVRLFTTSGQLLIEDSIGKTLDISALTPGAYFLEILTPDKKRAGATLINVIK